MNNLPVSPINTKLAIQATMLKKSVDTTKTIADKVIGMADTNKQIMKNTSSITTKKTHAFKANIVNKRV
jgi:hypothetical protein